MGIAQSMQDLERLDHLAEHFGGKMYSLKGLLDVLLPSVQAVSAVGHQHLRVALGGLVPEHDGQRLQILAKIDDVHQLSSRKLAALLLNQREYLNLRQEGMLVLADELL